MARLNCLLLRLFPLLCLILPTLQSARYGFPPDFLHVDMQDEGQSQLGRRIDSAYGFNEFVRSKRSVKILPGADAAVAAAAATTADVKKTESTTTSQPKPATATTSSQPFGASDSMQNAKNIATMVRIYHDSQQPRLQNTIYYLFYVLLLYARYFFQQNLNILESA